MLSLINYNNQKQKITHTIIIDIYYNPYINFTLFIKMEY